MYVEAVVSGQVMNTKIEGPKVFEGQTKGSTKYIVSVYQPGNDDLIKVQVPSAKFQEYKQGMKVDLPCNIKVWAFNGKSGITIELK